MATEPESSPDARTPDLLDNRRHDGTTLRHCSHGVAFEQACERCVDEALAREANRQIFPGLTPTTAFSGRS